MREWARAVAADLAWDLEADEVAAVAWAVVEDRVKE